MRGIEEDRDGKIYPMGIAYVGAALEDAGHEVIILDNNQKCYSKEKIIDFLKDLKPDIVGLTGMTNSYIQIMHLARMVKETIDVPVILGGAMATYTSHVLLPNMDVDICVLGEGEETSIELFDKWPNYHDVTGIAYLDDNGEYVKTAPRMFQKTRDEYPYPGYDGLLDITKYWRNELSSWQTPFRFDKYMRSYKDQVKPGMKINLREGEDSNPETATKGVLSGGDMMKMIRDTEGKYIKYQTRQYQWKQQWGLEGRD